jgi:type I restriction enzyme M protein
VDGRWRDFSIDEVRDQHFKLDAFKWLADEIDDDDQIGDDIEALLADVIDDLQIAIGYVSDMQGVLGYDNGEDNGR